MRSAHAVVLVAWLVGCGAASPSASPPSVLATHPQALDVMVIRDPRALPALAALLPPGLDLSGRVLLLPGAWLPDHPARLVVHELDAESPVALPAGVTNGAPAAEAVVAQVTGGVLTIAFQHDVNADGWCCSGIEQPDPLGACAGPPPLPPAPAEGDLTVHVFVVSADLVPGMQVHRSVSICMRP